MFKYLKFIAYLNGLKYIRVNNFKFSYHFNRLHEILR